MMEHPKTWRNRFQDGRWHKIGRRSYKRSAARYDAFLFGAEVPSSMWAWSVYWSGGHQSWVEGGFLAAKKRAEECIQGLEGAA
jgi:hypothetical protein